jgi:hypothetical protein
MFEKPLRILFGYEAHAIKPEVRPEGPQGRPGERGAGAMRPEDKDDATTHRTHPEPLHLLKENGRGDKCLDIEGF